jgi:WD40 repeat protein
MAVHDQAHQESIARIAMANDLLVTASDDHTIRTWDPTTGLQRLKLTHGNWARAIALSPDGTRMVSSSLDDTVCLWDIATGRKIYTLPGHGRLGGYRAVGFTPDGKYFLSWGDDLYLRKWSVDTGKAILEHRLQPTGVKVPSEDAEAGERERFWLLGQGLFSPDGTLFILSVGNQFHVFDVATGKDLRQVHDEGSGVIGLAISPNSQLLLASALGKEIQTKLPDGRTHISYSKDHPICLWELATGKLRKQVHMPEGGAGPVAFSPDGKLFVAATNGPEGCIRFWRVASGDEVSTIKGFRSSVRSLAFSPDGKRLSTGMDDTTALVWDVPGRH